ncbi:hypothetical protein JYK02_01365 [Corallococcus macrosporus]|uniref:Zinc finger PHD-type domain-containing protein n=1 Tax=Corallococcus macrosporus TaxID=35 RepID=A0ABS3D5I1_9BACT|nr:hypothetical protein [Corallococcus macrosporus]MBN8226152.1 hypothetical protein [Corallococcus macrosporus]
MAMIIKGFTSCAICGSTDLSKPYTATSGVAFPKEDELWRFCDAPLHFDCLARWPHRERFSRGYFDLWKDDSVLANGVLSGGRAWVLRCGPAKREADPYYAEVRLSDWPMRLYSRWEQWTDFAAHQYREGLEDEALKAADAAMAEVRKVAADLESLSVLRQRMLFSPTSH